MAESLTHQILVRHLLEWISAHVDTKEDASIYCDLPAESAKDKPQEIFGFTPDVLCSVRKSRQIILGEAKTAKDLETNHSRQQLAAFLRYLARNGTGQLLIAVPWHSVNKAKSLIKFLQKTTETTVVEVIFLEQLPG